MTHLIIKYVLAPLIAIAIAFSCGPKVERAVERSFSYAQQEKIGVNHR